MRSTTRRVCALAATSSFIVASLGQGTENGCCADFYYPAGGETYNNIDTVVASWSSNYPTANLTLFCLNPGNDYSYKKWDVDSTGTFTFSHFTSDVSIEQYPSTCHLELDNTEDLSNNILSPNFILTDIPGVSVNTFSTDPPTSTPTTAVVTTTAPASTETIVSIATPTASSASASLVTSTFTAAPTTITSSLTSSTLKTSSLSFTPLTSSLLSTSTANDILASGAAGTVGVSAAAAATSTPASTPSSSSTGLSTGVKAGIGVGCGVLGLALIGGLFYLFAMKKRLRKAENRASMYSAAVGRADSPHPVSSIGRASWAPVPQSDTFSDKHSVEPVNGYTYSNQGLNTATPIMGYHAGPTAGYEDGLQELGADQASYGIRHHELP